MMIYILIILLIGFIVAGIKYSGYEKKWTLFDVSVILILIIFASIRFNVGTDYQSYYYIYNYIVSSDFSVDAYHATHQEFGYYIVSWLTKKFFDSPYAIFWLSSILIYIPIYVRMKKDSEDLSYTLLLFLFLGFYTNSFNIMRQWIAIAINFYSLRYIHQNKTKFVFLNLLGTSFHYTCVIAMFVQLLAKRIRPTMMVLFLTCITGTIFAFLLIKMDILYAVLSTIDNRYIIYQEVRSPGIGYILLFILRLIIVLILLMISKSREYQYEKTLLIISLFFIILGFHNVYLGRMEAYFSITLVLCIPNILKQTTKRERLIYKYFFTMIFVSVFILSLIFYGNLIPYRTYLID